MTFRRTDVENPATHTQDVVNLARMHDPSEHIAESDDVKICSGKRSPEARQRLVRQLNNIRELMGFGECSHFLYTASASHENECNVLLRPKFTSGVQERLQRVTRTVVSRIHHDKFVNKPV
jgi:hypothetical protein